MGSFDSLQLLRSNHYKNHYAPKQSDTKTLLPIELYPRNSHLPLLPFHTKRSPSWCGIPHQLGAPPCQTWTNRPSQSQTPGCSKLPLQSSLTTILYTVLQQMKSSVCFVCLYCCLPSKKEELTTIPLIVSLLCLFAQCHYLNDIAHQGGSLFWAAPTGFEPVFQPWEGRVLGL